MSRTYAPQFRTMVIERIRARRRVAEMAAKSRVRSLGRSVGHHAGYCAIRAISRRWAPWRRRHKDANAAFSQVPGSSPGNGSGW